MPERPVPEGNVTDPAVLAEVQARLDRLRRQVGTVRHPTTTLLLLDRPDPTEAQVRVCRLAAEVDSGKVRREVHRNGRRA